MQFLKYQQHQIRSVALSRQRLHPGTALQSLSLEHQYLGLYAGEQLLDQRLEYGYVC